MFLKDVLWGGGTICDYVVTTCRLCCEKCAGPARKEAGRREVWGGGVQGRWDIPEGGRRTRAGGGGGDLPPLFATETFPGVRGDLPSAPDLQQTQTGVEVPPCFKGITFSRA